MVDLSKADPRNPQPGQVWERNGERRSVTGSAMGWRGEDEWVWSGSKCWIYDDWISWACPWWRRRKHWAKCVEVKQ